MKRMLLSFQFPRFQAPESVCSSTVHSVREWVVRDQPLKYADLSPTVKSEFFEFSCMRACFLYMYFYQN